MSILKFNRDNVKISIHSIYKGHYNVTYRGVGALRCPFDYVIYQMIISELRPDLVIEIGTHRGGGALYLADLMNLLGRGEVHTIDVESNYEGVVAEHPRIKIFHEGFEKYDLSQTDGYEKVLIIEDASHVYEDTLKALRKFAPVVSPGSYFIVEDGIINELGMKKEYHGGPLRAIKEFLRENVNFVVDRRWSDFFGRNATFNVDGYLRKIN